MWQDLVELPGGATFLNIFRLAGFELEGLSQTAALYELSCADDAAACQATTFSRRVISLWLVGKISMEDDGWAVGVMQKEVYGSIGCTTSDGSSSSSSSSARSVRFRHLGCSRGRE